LPQGLAVVGAERGDDSGLAGEIAPQEVESLIEFLERGERVIELGVKRGIGGGSEGDVQLRNLFQGRLPGRRRRGGSGDVASSSEDPLAGGAQVGEKRFLSAAAFLFSREKVILARLGDGRVDVGDEKKEVRFLNRSRRWRSRRALSPRRAGHPRRGRSAPRSSR